MFTLKKKHTNLPLSVIVYADEITLDCVDKLSLLNLRDAPIT